MAEETRAESAREVAEIGARSARETTETQGQYELQAAQAQAQGLVDQATELNKGALEVAQAQIIANQTLQDSRWFRQSQDKIVDAYVSLYGDAGAVDEREINFLLDQNSANVLGLRTALMTFKEGMKAEEVARAAYDMHANLIQTLTGTYGAPMAAGRANGNEMFADIKNAAYNEGKTERSGMEKFLLGSKKALAKEEPSNPVAAAFAADADPGAFMEIFQPGGVNEHHKDLFTRLSRGLRDGHPVRGESIREFFKEGGSQDAVDAYSSLRTLEEQLVNASSEWTSEKTLASGYGPAITHVHRMARSIKDAIPDVHRLEVSRIQLQPGEIMEHLNSVDPATKLPAGLHVVRGYMGQLFGDELFLAKFYSNLSRLNPEWASPSKQDEFTLRMRKGEIDLPPALQRKIGVVLTAEMEAAANSLKADLDQVTVDGIAQVRRRAALSNDAHAVAAISGHLGNLKLSGVHTDEAMESEDARMENVLTPIWRRYSPEGGEFAMERSPELLGIIRGLREDINVVKSAHAGTKEAFMKDQANKAQMKNTVAGEVSKLMSLYSPTSVLAQQEPKKGGVSRPAQPAGLPPPAVAAPGPPGPPLAAQAAGGIPTSQPARPTYPTTGPLGG
jgi:hypothetical protein